ncbi:MAG: lipid asymmetry maintenance protein MlaB [Halomonas sp.]
MSDLLARDGLRLSTRDGGLVVVGEVGFEHAAELAEAGSRWLAGREAGAGVGFDLTGVAGVSSAALSVLLEWARASRRAGLTLERVRLAGPLLRLTELAGLDRLLPVEADGA